MRFPCGSGAVSPPSLNLVKTILCGECSNLLGSQYLPTSSQLHGRCGSQRIRTSIWLHYSLHEVLLFFCRVASFHCGATVSYGDCPNPQLPIASLDIRYGSTVSRVFTRRFHLYALRTATVRSDVARSTVLAFRSNSAALRLLHLSLRFTVQFHLEHGTLVSKGEYVEFDSTSSTRSLLAYTVSRARASEHILTFVGTPLMWISEGKYEENFWLQHWFHRVASSLLRATVSF